MNQNIEILKEERYIDKSEWSRGEWDNEPDKLHFVDKATDMDCLIVRGSGGALCGYVGVEPGHPMHKVDYNRAQVDVHGGLTYGSMCQEDGKICHVPRLERSHEVYWLGFDCAHSGDLSPAQTRHFPMPTGYEHYCSLYYVIEQTKSLALQLAKREPPRELYDWEKDDERQL